MRQTGVRRRGASSQKVLCSPWHPWDWGSRPSPRLGTVTRSNGAVGRRHLPGEGWATVLLRP